MKNGTAPQQDILFRKQYEQEQAIIGACLALFVEERPDHPVAEAMKEIAQQQGVDLDKMPKITLPNSDKDALFAFFESVPTTNEGLLAHTV